MFLRKISPFGDRIQLIFEISTVQKLISFVYQEILQYQTPSRPENSNNITFLILLVFNVVEDTDCTML